ncbi:MAG: hypothetical protein ACOVP4_09690 [Bacteriovoracaceae bacterium]
MMKNNLGLLLVFILLLTGTYVWIERPDRVWWQKHDETYRLRSLVENAESFGVLGKTWTLKENQWVSGQDLLSLTIWPKWKRIFSQLKFEREIILNAQTNKDNFLGEGFPITIDDRSFILGETTVDGKSLYLLDVNENKILQMSLLPSDLFQMLDEVKEKTPQDMIEKRVFAYFNNVQFTKVVFETPGILSFDIDLFNKQTNPRPIPGILLHPHLDQKFWHEMDLLQFTEQIKPDLALLYQKMASLSLVQDEKKVLTFELHRVGPLNADAVVYVPEKNQMFKVRGNTAKVFFDQVQDYWDLKIIPRNVFKAFTETRAQFVLGDKEVTVNIINQEPLAFVSPDSQIKLKEDKLQNLFNLIFNLSQYEEASRVSILTKAERQQFQNESHIRMNVFGQDLMLVRKTNELVVVNFTQGFKAHFFFFDISIGDQWEDFFTS